ncbi:hypothetical protein G7054_g15039 [Neopestalotiopsis clavispora]|nr:hypothetical protein G7054_g15039 [Neopestalotiopsis clavispora]
MILTDLFTADPFDGASWSDPVVFKTGVIDPDLFWDDDGTVYIAQAGVVLQSIDLDTGALSPETPLSVWNGTGGNYPEGPHLYKKDDWYYLLIAEGGTELNHSITIARSSSVWGPYESYEGNPLLTGKGSDSLFQTVGHGDLFQDGAGNWWGAALSTRCGPEYEIYPMGRETVLYPATWAEGEWPVLDRVQGIMNGWPLPATSRDVPGDGPFNADPDAYDFLAARRRDHSAQPRVLARAPRRSLFRDGPGPADRAEPGQPDRVVGPQPHGPGGVDVLFNPEGSSAEAETGITVFLTQYNHIDLGLVLVQPEDDSSAAPQLTLRLRAEAPYVDNPSVPPSEALAPVLVPVPSTWASNATITLQVQTANETHYRFSAWPTGDPNAQVVLGTASAQLVSGGSGTFVGTLIGAYATCNGAGEDLDCPDGGNAYIQNWQYRGAAQAISTVELVSSIISSS